jgi:hypothetical protein
MSNAGTAQRILAKSSAEAEEAEAEVVERAEA